MIQKKNRFLGKRFLWLKSAYYSGFFVVLVSKEILKIFIVVANFTITVVGSRMVVFRALKLWGILVLYS